MFEVVSCRNRDPIFLSLAFGEIGKWRSMLQEKDEAQKKKKISKDQRN